MGGAASRTKSTGARNARRSSQATRRLSSATYTTESHGAGPRETPSTDNIRSAQPLIRPSSLRNSAPLPSTSSSASSNAVSLLGSFDSEVGATTAEVAGSTESCLSNAPPSSSDTRAPVDTVDCGGQKQNGQSTMVRCTSATVSASGKVGRKQRNGGNIGTGLGDGVVPLEEGTAVLITALMKPYCSLIKRIFSSSVIPAALSSSQDPGQVLNIVGSPHDAANRCRQTFQSSDIFTLVPYVESIEFGHAPQRKSRANTKAAAFSSATLWVPSLTACFAEGLLYRVEWRKRENVNTTSSAEGCAEEGTYVLWCFFNVTHVYLMEIDVSFPESASLTTSTPMPFKALGTTRVEWVEAGEYPGVPYLDRRRRLIARVACPPLRCVAFIEGTVGPFSTAVRAVPLSCSIPISVQSPTLKWRVTVEAALQRLRHRFEATTAISDLSKQSATEAVLHTCVKENIPFVDAWFSPGEMALSGGGAPCARLVDLAAFPVTSSLGTSRHSSEEMEKRSVAWARASDIVQRLCDQWGTHSALEPHVFFLPISPVFIEPGDLGDSWVVGAMAVLAEHTHLLIRMFRHPFSPKRGIAEQRLGAYRVTLNVRGWWRSVTVDDFFPLAEGCNYMKYAHSRRDVRELWVPLLEKAYAKLSGGYLRMAAGDPLVALRDFTGWPCAHYDISLFSDIADVSAGFASRLMRYDRYGFHIILHTAPRFHTHATPPQSDGYSSLAESSLPSLVETTSAGAFQGLLAAMVYPVMRVLQFSTKPFCAELTLLKVRNPWGDVAAWRGRWRCGSPLWSQWPQIAAVCHMQDSLHRGGDDVVPTSMDHPQDRSTAPQASQATKTTADLITNVCDCRRHQYIWVEWSEVYRYFAGCDVLYRLALHYDYRVRGLFEATCPSVCLRVSVAARTFIGATLSMGESVGASFMTATGTNGASTCPPIMLTLAREEAGMLHVVRNSQLDPDNPTTSFTFMQADNASLFFLLKPDESPYWLIPRILTHHAPSAAGGESGPATGRCAPRFPYVLTLFQKERVGENGFMGEFYRFPPTSAVFTNRRSFSVDSPLQSVTATFQVRAPHAAFPRTYVHRSISESEATPVSEFRLVQED